MTGGGERDTLILERSMKRRLNAIISREDDGYVGLCPELDISSQGDTVEQARANLAEALTLFFEAADPSEVEQRLRDDVYLTQIELDVALVEAVVPNRG